MWLVISTISDNVLPDSPELGDSMGSSKSYIKSFDLHTDAKKHYKYQVKWLGENTNVMMYEINENSKMVGSKFTENM
jgi:hypothetical protein